MKARAAVLSPALLCAAAAALGLATGWLGVRQVRAAQASHVELTARRFAFSVRELHLKKGVPAVIDVTALDFPHGFNIPELGVRADLVPGKVVQVRFTPQKAGRFLFLCDNFCGSGHEEMNGVVIVDD